MYTIILLSTITVMCFIIAFALAIVYVVSFNKDKSIGEYIFSKVFRDISMCFLIITCVFGAIALTGNSHKGNNHTYKEQYEQIISDYDAYKDTAKYIWVEKARKYNEDVEFVKHKCESKWTNWFYFEYNIDELQTIDIDEVINK